VIGTAGHVDHGKTALVRALTGVDTDRLPEEKRRGISIDLGFAELVLPSGRHAAIVDVPGHERFIRNMLAGASGIDLALLVVAADEGVMPQTREHAEITWLLGVTDAVVALSKADLAQDDWLALVGEDVRAFLRDTPFASAPVLPVSAQTGQGLPALRQALDDALAGARRRQNRGPARMAIDRVFSVPGFGTVVTGTLTSGAVAVEDHLELLPRGGMVRLRGLQVHGRPVARASAGQRVAANLAGIARADVRRGHVLAAQGSLGTAERLAVRLHTLPGNASPLKNGQRLHLHLGTAEVLCRATLLADDALDPGASGYALLRLEQPVASGAGDRFILRSYSPVRTVGGGLVLEVGRHFRRHRVADLEDLALIEQGDPAELLLAAFSGRPQTVAAAARRAGLPPGEAQPHVDALEAAGRLVALGGTADAALYMAEGDWADMRASVLRALEAYHARYPLRSGMPRGELRGTAMANLDARETAVALTRLAAAGEVRADGERVALAGHAPTLRGALADVAERLVDQLRTAGLQPRPVTAALAAAGWVGDEAERGELLAHLVDTGRLMRVDPTLYFATEAMREAVDRVRAYLGEHGTATVAELRDLLGISRKYAVPLAEYLDGIHVTRREGDARRLV
jgi:selenocysteine-specific elongation factor